MAIERLPEGDRLEGRRLFAAFLAAWAQLRTYLESYYMCPGQARDIRADNARIELLVAVDMPGQAAEAVVTTVAHLVGLPSDESASQPIPRMLLQRLLKDHNDLLATTGVQGVFADEGFNLRGALGPSVVPRQCLDDVPWADEASVRGLMVTGTPGGGPALSEEAAARELDQVAGLFSRFVYSAQADPALVAAMARAREREAAELAALADADRIQRVSARILDSISLLNYLKCPRCRAPFVVGSPY